MINLINLINLSFSDRIKKEVGDIISYFLPLYPLSILLYLFLCLASRFIQQALMTPILASTKPKNVLSVTINTIHLQELSFRLDRLRVSDSFAEMSTAHKSMLSFSNSYPLRLCVRQTSM